MQRLGNLNNKLIVESIYEPDNKNVIWKDTINNEFKEYKEGGWVKSENLDTPKEAFPYEFVKLDDMTVSVKDGKQSSETLVGHFDGNKSLNAFIGVLDSNGTKQYIAARRAGGPSAPIIALDATLYGSVPNYVLLTFWISNNSPYNIGDIVLKVGRAYSDIPEGDYVIKDITFIM